MRQFGRVTYAKPVDFEPEGEPARVTEAWLIAPSGEAMRSCVGRRRAQRRRRAGWRRIPAGHLLF
jgi:hypothetical protein